MADTANLSAEGETRRDFLAIVAWSGLGIGTAAALWPMVYSMNPSADVLALSTTTVDLSNIEEGMGITVMWRGSPVFVRHRTPEEINEAEDVDISTLRDPEADSARVEKPEWLVVSGVCTHLGCVPLGNNSGDFDGWFCPCHGSHYDTAGRIRRGPAPQNLHIPVVSFVDDTTIQLG